jgi:hypothetical protein
MILRFTASLVPPTGRVFALVNAGEDAAVTVGAWYKLPDEEHRARAGLQQTHVLVPEKALAQSAPTL